MYNGLVAETRAASLTAATATNVDFDTKGGRSIALTIENTGANAIGTVEVWKSVRGTKFAQDTALTAAIGSIAAAGVSLVELTDCSFATLRLRMTSASGSTYSVEFRAG
jgi:hypothetical protein